MLKIQHHKVLLLHGLIVVALVSAGAFWLWWFSHSIVEVKNLSNEQPGQEVSRVVSIASDVLFTGNSFWGRYTNDAAQKTKEPYKFPFARLHEFKRKNYDAWVTGLECPTTEKGIAMTAAEMEAALSFNCDPNYLSEFAKWFDIVTLANNHTDNMGADGFAETKTALKKNGIQYVGHYDPDVLDEQCKVVLLPVKVRYDTKPDAKEKLPIAACGYHGVFKIPSSESVAEITKYSKLMPVIVFPHAGAEYKAGPDEIKTTMYRAMIDAGADMIIGDHPHWIQNTEAYKGKLIVYSMGNFMFDQQFNTEVTRSAAIKMRLTVQDSSRLDSWIELGRQCQSNATDCLNTIQAQHLPKYTPSYRFDFIPVSNKGYQTHPAPELNAGIEARLNWQATMAALGQK